MKHQGPGLSEAMRQDWMRAKRRARGMRLVVDKTCPLPAQRDPAMAIKGIRAIYGYDDGGPPDAA